MYLYKGSSDTAVGTVASSLKITENVAMMAAFDMLPVVAPERQVKTHVTTHVTPLNSNT